MGPRSSVAPRAPMTELKRNGSDDEEWNEICKNEEIA